MDSPYENLGDAATYVARAELMFELERYDEAREELGGALSVDPANVEALTLLAILELQVENYDDALTAASSALAAEPTHERAVLARAHALALLHRTDEALDAAEALQQWYPDSWWYNMHYALIVREARNGQDALDAAWAAVRLAPEEARAHLALAVVAATLGLDDLANRALSAAARFDPNIDVTLEGELGPTLLRHGPDATHARPRASATASNDTQEPKNSSTPLPEGIDRLLRTAAAVGLALPMLVACVSQGESGVMRTVAAIGSIAAVVGLVIYGKRLPKHVWDETRARIDEDKLFGLLFAVGAASPVLTMLYAISGYLYALGIATLTGMATLGLLVMRTRT